MYSKRILSTPLRVVKIPISLARRCSCGDENPVCKCLHCAMLARLGLAAQSQLPVQCEQIFAFFARAERDTTQPSEALLRRGFRHRQDMQPSYRSHKLGIIQNIGLL